MAIKLNNKTRCVVTQRSVQIAWIIYLSLFDLYTKDRDRYTSVIASQSSVVSNERGHAPQSNSGAMIGRLAEFEVCFFFVIICVHYLCVK